MDKIVDYYLSVQSPWTYLGHDRLLASADRHGARIQPHPVDFGVVFPATGGLPLPKRAPERRAYRMMELKRWRRYLDIPLTLEPKFFPANEKLAIRLVIVAQEAGDDVLSLVGAILRAVWAEERDIGNVATLREICSRCGHDDEALIAAAESDAASAALARNSQAAVDRGVFGAPTYAYRDELFWGQDRLEFLDRALAG